MIKRNVSANQLITLISEGSCDTEDCSNDAAENLALHHRNKLCLKIYYNRKQLLSCNNISQYYFFFLLYFDQVNAALVSIREFFQKQFI